MLLFPHEKEFVLKIQVLGSPLC